MLSSPDHEDPMSSEDAPTIIEPTDAPLLTAVANDTLSTQDPLILEPQTEQPPTDAEVAAAAGLPVTQPPIDATPAPNAPTAEEPSPDPALVYFRSTQPENAMFEVMNIIPSRDQTGRYLIWAMSPEDAERFERHCFIEQGRIARV